MHTTLVTGGLLLLVALSTRSYAAAMRCGETGPVVASGASTADVLTACGPPTHRDTRRECRESRADRPRGSGQGPFPETDCIMVDIWTYNFGPRRLVHQLIFKNGRLTTIHTHGYGQ